MEVKLLDHGHLRLVESWGSDEGVIEAARMSTGKGFKGWGPKTERDSKGGSHTLECASWALEGTEHYAGSCDCDPTPGDEKLLKYLWDNAHHTPFEMAGLTFEVKAPIFVIRQWHRHRVPFSYNEMSARYAPLPDEDYVPTVERLMAGGGANKQAQGTGAALTVEDAERSRQHMQSVYDSAQALYRYMLDKGVPKELARLVLPVARYSVMRASANLRGWLAFLKLRMDAHAQYEIRVYAEAIGAAIAEAFPRTWEVSR